MKKATFIKWSGNAPYSDCFDDVYYSTDNGLEESRYVFLQGSNIAGHLGRGKPLTLVELGFGTGLNFCMTWQYINQCTQPLSHLTYIAVEAYPLLKEDMHRALSCWPELSLYSDALLKHYPHSFVGKDVFEYTEGNLTLILYIGDVMEVLPNIKALADIWYLDGFAPDKNPDMWSEGVFAGMAERSYQHTSFATFTAASKVQKFLKDYGFNVEKKPGYGKKREMLTGNYRGKAYV